MILALVGQDRPPVAAQLFVLVLKFAPGAPLAAPLAEVLGAASGHQFSIDRAKISAMSSSATGRGQVAKMRCCFMVPDTRSGMSASV